MAGLRKQIIMSHIQTTSFKRILTNQLTVFNVSHVKACVLVQNIFVFDDTVKEPLNNKDNQPSPSSPQPRLNKIYEKLILQFLFYSTFLLTFGLAELLSMYKICI